MKKVLLTSLAVATVAVLGTATLSSQSVSLPVQLSAAILAAIPPPVDQPMLDAFGNVMLDASGNPMSDPNEKFHSVKPQEFDPNKSHLVQAAWLHGIGCPTATQVFDFFGTPTPVAEPACPDGDPKDKEFEGLLLVKTGPSTENFASAVAELKKVKGITLMQLGYDIRKFGGFMSAMGSHCGAGAPRFNVVTTDGVTHFIGCSSPPPLETVGTAWTRLRWTAAMAFPPITMPVQRIQIVFDEGTDTGPDFFGAAILDNIFVNGQIVGHGACDCD